MFCTFRCCGITVRVVASIFDESRLRQRPASLPRCGRPIGTSRRIPLMFAPSHRHTSRSLFGSMLPASKHFVFFSVLHMVLIGKNRSTGSGKTYCGYGTVRRSLRVRGAQLCFWNTRTQGPHISESHRNQEPRSRLAALLERPILAQAPPASKPLW